MAGVYITPRQGQRIANAVRRVEGDYTPDQRRGRADNRNPGVVRAKVTTAIPTGTFDAPSDAGEAQIYHKNPTTREWEAWRDPVKVMNDHTLSASIAINKVVKLAWIDGDWWLVAADC